MGELDPGPRDPEILVVDDDADVRRALGAILARLGHPTRQAGSLGEARAALAERPAQVVFLDLRLPDGDGLTLLEELSRERPETAVVVITAYGDVDHAVRSMRLGAVDLLEKPFTDEQIAATVAGLTGPAGVPDPERPSQLVGGSPVFLEACRRIRLLAAAPATTALLLGESGTGKELAARAVHGMSERAGGPFVAINCAALTDTLLEAELFGYERGAFTGAAAEGKAGLFEAAHGGTIFLDEVAELRPELQAKLLRVLQERTVKRVGSLSERPVDVRVVASTHRDLEARVQAGAFRQDLLYRLNVMPITLPPLRERGEDVVLLAHHFLKKLAPELGRTQVKGFSPEALRRLRRYPWPGNVRELRNVIERALIVATTAQVEAEQLLLPDRPGPVAPGEAGAEVRLDLPDCRLASAERALIAVALERAGGQKTRAAELLGINRATLYNKLKAYGLGEPPGRSGQGSR